MFPKELYPVWLKVTTKHQSHREIGTGMSLWLRTAKNSFSEVLWKVLNALFFLPQLSSLFLLDFPPPYFFPTPLFISFLIGKTNQRALNLNLVFKAPKHKWIRDQIQLINTSSDRNHLWLSSFKFLHDFLLRNTAVVFHLLFLSRLFFHLSLMIQTTVTPMKPTQLY